MGKVSKKSKTDFLLEALQPKEYMSFERYLVSRLGKSHNFDYYGYWTWKKDCMQKIQKGEADTIKPYVNDLSRKFRSDFNKLIESYYVHVAVDRDDELKDIFLLREMRMRKVDRMFIDYLKRAKGFNKNHTLKGFVNNVNAVRSHFEEYMLLNSLNDEPGMVKAADGICELSEIVYYQNELFNFINTKLFVHIAFEPALKVDIIIRKIEDNSAFFEKEHLNVYVLYLISKLLRESKPIADVIEIINYLIKREKKFTSGFLKATFESLLRIAIVRINEGDKDALKISYHAIKSFDKKGILQKLPQIQPLVFFAGVSLALGMNDIVFAEKLINNYSKKLFYVPHDDVLAICKAMVYYEKGKLYDAKDLLSSLRVKNVTLYIYSKTTLLKVLYDKNELRGIMSMSDSVKHFLQRKVELQDAYRERIFKFLSYITHLSLAKRKNGRGLIQIRERLDLETNFFQMQWVTEKLEELEKIYFKQD